MHNNIVQARSDKCGGKCASRTPFRMFLHVFGVVLIGPCFLCSTVHSAVQALQTTSMHPARIVVFTWVLASMDNREKPTRQRPHEVIGQDHSKVGKQSLASAEAIFPITWVSPRRGEPRRALPKMGKLF